MESAFRRQQVTVDTIFVSRRIPLRAAVLQVVREGVKGVVFLEEHHQAIGRVTLQLFSDKMDYSGTFSF